MRTALAPIVEAICVLTPKRGRKNPPEQGIRSQRDLVMHRSRLNSSPPPLLIACPAVCGFLASRGIRGQSSYKSRSTLSKDKPESLANTAIDLLPGLHPLGPRTRWIGTPDGEKGRRQIMRSSKMKALVCGAGGFIGGHLVKRLKAEGYWVVGADQKEHDYATSLADAFVLGDLRDPRIVQTLFDQQFDEVYQLAADMGGGRVLFSLARMTPMCDANCCAQTIFNNPSRLSCRERRVKNVRFLFIVLTCCFTTRILTSLNTSSNRPVTKTAPYPLAETR